MTDKLAPFTVLCSGGLDSTQNHIYLDNNFPGKASRLVNYEVGLNGGYARLTGFRPLDVIAEEVAPGTTEGKILGVAIFTTTAGSNLFYAMRKKVGVDQYGIYRLDNGIGWTEVTTGLTLSSLGVDKIRHAKFNFGAESWIIFVDGANNATLTNGTDWYALNSTSAGGEPDPGGNQILDAPSYVTVFQNHIFLSGDLSYPAIVCHSAPQDPFTWTAAAGGGQLPTGFIVNQIKPFRDTLYVTGQNNISKITVNGENFVINSVTSNIGCIASDSVVEVNGDLQFMAPDGIRTISGTERIGDVELACISKPIQELVNFLNDSYDLNNLTSVVIRGKSQFRYFVSQGDGTDIGRGIIGGLRVSDQLNGWEFGELYGIRASVTDSAYLGKEEFIIHGDYNGKVYRQEIGDDFDGQPVVSIYSTPYLTLGDPTLRKLVREVTSFYRVEGSYDMSISFDFDWARDDVLEPDAYSQANITSGVTYNNGYLYNQGNTYVGGSLSPVITTSVEGSWKSIKINFSTSDTNAPHTIQGFVIEFTPQARR